MPQWQWAWFHCQFCKADAAFHKLWWTEKHSEWKLCCSTLRDLLCIRCLWFYILLKTSCLKSGSCLLNDLMMKNANQWILSKFCLNSQFVGPLVSKVKIEHGDKFGCFFLKLLLEVSLHCSLSMLSLPSEVWLHYCSSGGSPCASLSFWSMCNWEPTPSRHYSVLIFPLTGSLSGV